MRNSVFFNELGKITLEYASGWLEIDTALCNCAPDDIQNQSILAGRAIKALRNYASRLTELNKTSTTAFESATVNELLNGIDTQIKYFQTIQENIHNTEEQLKAHQRLMKNNFTGVLGGNKVH